MTGQRFGVVGGGMLGLTLAHRLAGQGHHVTLIEAADRVGGLASAWQLGDVVWDRHYHVTLLSDLRTRTILDELGLGDEVRWRETRTGYFADGRLSSVSNTIEFLRLPGLSPLDKLRLGGTIFYGSRVRDWRRLERTLVDDWLTRLSGRRVFERFWRPLLRAKLGDAHRDASAAFIWATIQRLYAARRTGMKREMFGYVPGGYARVLEHFVQELHAEGVDVRLGRAVSAVRCAAGGAVDVEMADGSRLGFDQVVVTANPQIAARLCPDLSPAEHERLGSIRYQGIVCASLLLDRPLSPYYLTNITDELPFTAVVDMSALVDGGDLGDHGLVYLPRYCAKDDPLQRANDDQVLEAFLPALARIYPEFRPERVVAARVSRVAEVFPLPTLRYSERVPPVASSVPGLHLVSSANIVNGTLNVNETVELAESTAASLAGAASAVEVPA